MNRPTPPNVLLPRPPRWPWLAFLASLLLHVPILLTRFEPWLPPVQVPERLVLIPLGSEGPRAVAMPFRVPITSGGARPRTRTAGISQLPRPETGPPPEAQTDTVPTRLVEEPADTTREVGPESLVRRRFRIGPARGEGPLWIQPLPLPPKDLAQAVTRSHYELVDSAVTAIVQEYIDSVLNAPTDPGLRPPSWTTTIAGQRIGLDSKFIYLGPIKIPTALLALLPLNLGSEVVDFTRFRQLQQTREDLQRAAQRAETMEEFKRAVREMRVERERQREFAKNQKVPPRKQPSDTTKPKIP